MTLKYLTPYLLPASYYYENGFRTVAPVYIKDRSTGDGYRPDEYSVVMYDISLTNIIEESAWYQAEEFYEYTPLIIREIQQMLDEFWDEYDMEYENS